jgi:D-alanine-D-alanine ligase
MKSGRKLKIAVLLQKGLIPPSSKKGFSEEEISNWIVEYDVISTLKSMGHEVFPVEMYGELDALRSALEEFKPHIAFNLLEEYHEFPMFDQQVVSYLELKKIPYTGCNPRGLMISKDKALSKKILWYHNICVPRFFVFPYNKRTKKNGYRYPLFVKPLSEEGSIGISKDSLVQTQDKLFDRINYLHSSYQTDVIAEEFIEGREIYVGVIGNHKLSALPPWELVIKNEKSDTPIFTSRLKWDKKHQEKMGLTTHVADLSKNLLKKFEIISKTIYKELKLSGYARLDYKLTENEEIFLIEANPNPFIAEEEDFAQSAKHIKINYPELITKIMNAGLNYKPF